MLLRHFRISAERGKANFRKPKTPVRRKWNLGLMDVNRGRRRAVTDRYIRKERATTMP